MTDKGGVELNIRWKSSSSDLEQKSPSLSVVAIPLSIDAEALAIQGYALELQVNKTHVNDNDLDSVIMGDCSGYITVYPGYVSKRMEPPPFNVRTYPITWSIFYRDDENYFIYAKLGPYVLGEDLQYFWGRFG